MSKLALRLSIAAVLVVILTMGTVMVVFIGSIVTSSAGQDSQALGGAPCLTTIEAGQQQITLDAEQLANARTIVAVGTQMGVPGRGAVIALATAFQESGMRNLHTGDRDSVGLFQQRPSAGWGSVSELTQPSLAAQKFYTALMSVDGWQTMALTLAAQTVQRSAFPLAYAQWESAAATLAQRLGARSVDVIGCGTLLSQPLPTGVIGAMLRSALAQQGKPYIWGATGPQAFDCSGLVVYAWGQAGYRLNLRTADQMYRAAVPVAAGAEAPGDLLFGDFTAAGAGHVMIVVQPGLAVEAPHTGDVVRLQSYRDGQWRIGRLPPGVFTVLQPSRAVA